MVAASRCLTVAALLAHSCVSGFRSSRREQTKSIAGVPVFNYHLAYESTLQVSGSTAAERDWVVVVKPGTTDTQIEALCRPSKRCKLAGHPEGGVPFLEIHGSESDLEAMIHDADGVAEFVEPSVNLDVIPDIEVDAQGTAASWGLDRIGAPLRPSTGRGVNIYMVDTGVRTTHMDFGGRAIATLDVSSGDVVECGSDSSATCAKDVVGHGTHCAGTAAGSNYGVAPEVTLHSVKVIADYSYSDSSWSYAALDWLARKGVKPAVVSMSLGTEGVLKAFQTSVDAAVNAGLTVVVAAGNFNRDACQYSPAHVRSAITVGAATRSDTRADFSNFGGCTNIWAPGEEITSLGYFADDQERVLSGTSMACPHVSGGAALLLEANPAWSSQEVLGSMLGSGVSGAIVGLKGPADTNTLLWVGAGPAPEPTQATCSAASSGPDSDGDCRCDRGKRCYQGGDFGCVWSRGSRSSSYHLISCWNCVCK